MKKLVFLVFFILLLVTSTTSVYAFSIKDSLTGFSISDFLYSLFHRDVVGTNIRSDTSVIKPLETEHVTDNSINDIPNIQPSVSDLANLPAENTQSIQSAEDTNNIQYIQNNQAGAININTQEPIVVGEENNLEENGNEPQQVIIIAPVEEGNNLEVNPNSGQQIIYPNTKDVNLYSSKNVFLISDENWHNILPLVPVTTWTDESGEIHKYPTLVYHMDEFFTGANYASLSNGASATASSTYQYSNPNNAVDGNIDTSWNNGNTNQAWLLINLGQFRSLNKIRLFDDADLYSISISVSSDNINFNNIETDYTLSLGWNDLNFEDPLVNVRYIKIILSDQPGQSSYPNWKQIAEIQVYDTNEGQYLETFDADSIIHFMQLYNPDKVTIIGTAPQELQDLLIAPFDPATKEGGAGLNENQLEIVQPNEYLDYWSSYNNVVWVQNDYKLTLLASTYASLLNAPLIIGPQVNYNLPVADNLPIEENTENSNLQISGDAVTNPNLNLGSYSAPIFQNKHVIVVGNMNCPSNAENCEYFRTIEDIQHDYISKTNTDKILLTNPNDINSDIIQEYPYLEKSSGTLNNIYGKHSLIAPILASGKHELIVLDDHIESQNPPERWPDWNTTNQLVKNYTENFFNNDAEYLTILAPPSMIAQSKFIYNIITGAYDSETDSIYAKEPDSTGTEFFLAPGRIYGISPSDVSSYIARSFFYDELISNVYEIQEYTAFTIGRECYGPEYSDIMKSVKDYLEMNGYDNEKTLCSTYPENPNGCEHIGTYLSSPEEQDLLRHKQFIQFSDHGGQYIWGNALYSNMIPWLDLPVSGGVDACLTNNFYGYNYGGGGGFVYRSFGANMLRKGAMSYTGSIPPAQYLLGLEEDYINILTANKENTLGYANKVFCKGPWRYDPEYIMLGDPTLMPKFKDINNFNYECYDFMDNDNDGLIDYDDTNCTSPYDFEGGPKPGCNDGLDNDNDVLRDYPNDTGCNSIQDNTENLCGDTITESFTLEDDLNCLTDGLKLFNNQVGQELILNCNNHVINSILEYRGYSGIVINSNSHNITVKNCIIRNFNYGVYMLNFGDNIKLISNDIQSNNYGISAPTFGSNIHLISNQVKNNYETGVNIEDVSSFELTSNIVLNNTEDEEADIYCSESDGFYSNGQNTCQIIENHDCNPPITCSQPGGALQNED